MIIKKPFNFCTKRILIKISKINYFWMNHFFIFFHKCLIPPTTPPTTTTGTIIGKDMIKLPTSVTAATPLNAN